MSLKYETAWKPLHPGMFSIDAFTIRNQVTCLKLTESKREDGSLDLVLAVTFSSAPPQPNTHNPEPHNAKTNRQPQPVIPRSCSIAGGLRGRGGRYLHCPPRRPRPRSLPLSIFFLLALSLFLSSVALPKVRPCIPTSPTLHPKLRTPNTKHQTPNTKHQTPTTHKTNAHSRHHGRRDVQRSRGRGAGGHVGHAWGSHRVRVLGVCAVLLGRGAGRSVRPPPPQS